MKGNFPCKAHGIESCPLIMKLTQAHFYQVGKQVPRLWGLKGE